MSAKTFRLADQRRKSLRYETNSFEVALLSLVFVFVVVARTCGGHNLPEYTELDITEETIIEESEKTQKELDENNVGIEDFKTKYFRDDGLNSQESDPQTKSILDIEEDEEIEQETPLQEQPSSSVQSLQSKPQEAIVQQSSQVSQPIKQSVVPIQPSGNPQNVPQGTTQSITSSMSPNVVQTNAPVADDLIEVIHPKGETDIKEEENAVRDALSVSSGLSETNEPTSDLLGQPVAGTGQNSIGIPNKPQELTSQELQNENSNTRTPMGLQDQSQLHSVVNSATGNQNPLVTPVQIDANANQPIDQTNSLPNERESQIHSQKLETTSEISNQEPEQSEVYV